jgi:8-oxo-dGTP pyrophosphatase MutT (NUDIX family)
MGLDAMDGDAPGMDGEKKPMSMTAAGGVLFDPISGRVLIIRRNGYLDLPKGKLETGETIGQAALREVMEEVGVPEPRLGPLICETRHGYVMDGKAIQKTTHWFVMTWESDRNALDYPCQPQKEEGISEVLWMEPEAALGVVGYENLKQVLARFLDMKKG